MDDYGSFSFCAHGVRGDRNILGQGIGFATMAALVTRDPFWDEIISLLHARIDGLPAEAVPAETDPPATEAKEPEPVKRTRKPRKETPAETTPATEPETPPAETKDGPSLQDALHTITSGEIQTEEPPFEVSRDDLMAQCRTRAGKGPEGASWLREHIIGGKYARLSEVPNDVLVRALAV